MDDPSGIPPHELRGVLGTVVDRGDVGGVPRAPGPSVVTSTTPGLATAAAAPPPTSPSLPEADPNALALVLQRMANELFGASMTPVPGALPPGVPSPQDAMPAPGALAPASPGIAPQLVPHAPDLRAPTDPIVPQLVASLPGVPHAPATPASHLPPARPDAPPSPAGALPSSSDPFAGLALPRSLPLVDERGAVDAIPTAPEPPPTRGLDQPLAFGDGVLPDLLVAPDVMRFPMVDAGPLEPTIPAEPATPQHALYAAEPRAPIRQGSGTAFDPHLVRRDFPILDERVHGKRLVWLDNAATTQKPRAVIDRLVHYYEHENSNVHRAAHALAARATDAYESARETTRRFLNAPSASEIVFVRGATEGINLVAKTWGWRHVEAGDEILVTHLEHHANIVPWQQLCTAKGARLRVAPVDDRGDVILEEYERLFTSRTKLVAFTQVSNALGTITPAREMIEIAHRHGACVLLDGAQAVSHMPVDVQALDCDFYVFSGHKVFAPTGIGAVFGKRALLEHMPPWQGGGNMIQDVTFEKTVYQAPPWRFEAGTGNIADAAGLGAALEYVMRIGMATIDRYEHELLAYATARIHEVPGLRLIGTSPHKAGVLSFVLDGQRTEDVGAMLDKEGIAVRSGHHCAQPILRRFGLEATVRASLAFYNVCEDIDALVDALQRIQAGRPSQRL